MSALSAKLRDVQGGGLMFWCPGCEGAHCIWHGEGKPPRWTWNGDADRPTFSPSILVTGRDFTPSGREAYQRWYDAGGDAPAPQFEAADTRCHSFVRDGRIEFLADCTHALAGKTVDLPDFDA